MVTLLLTIKSVKLLRYYAIFGKIIKYEEESVSVWYI